MSIKVQIEYPNITQDCREKLVQITQFIILLMCEMFSRVPDRDIKVCQNAGCTPTYVVSEHAKADNPQIIIVSADAYFWAQYTFQFSHEFCHMLMQAEKTFSARNYRFAFFEEALCWACSICVLRAFNRKDFVSPFYDNDAFSNYADKEIKKYITIQSLSSWINENFEALSTDFHPTNCDIDGARQRANTLGITLLPHTYMQNFWSACAFITASPEILSAQSIEQFFDIWESVCPTDCRSIPTRLRAVFAA